MIENAPINTDSTVFGLFYSHIPMIYYITAPISNFPRIYRIFLSYSRQTAKISASENFFYVSIGLLPDVLGVMDVSVVDCRRGITQHGGHQVDVLCF